MTKNGPNSCHFFTMSSTSRKLFPIIKTKTLDLDTKYFRDVCVLMMQDGNYTGQLRDGVRHGWGEMRYSYDLPRLPSFAATLFNACVKNRYACLRGFKLPPLEPQNILKLIFFVCNALNAIMESSGSSYSLKCCRESILQKQMKKANKNVFSSVYGIYR